MDIFINTEKSPAMLQAKVTGSPLSAFKVKRGATVHLSVTVLGSQSAAGLRMGIKAKGNYEGDLLILAEAATGTQTEHGTRFDLKLVAASAALNDALDVGEGIDTVPASIAAMTEFAWQEGGETYLSDTLQTVIANDIIRLATDAPVAAAGIYPAPDLVATKSWVNGRIATADEVGFVMLGTDETITGKHVRPVGKTATGGMAVDVSGLSAYDIAVANGFVGTESAWLASMKGERGSKGEQGEVGERGASAYEMWLEEGHVGSEKDFFADLGTSALTTMYDSPSGTATDNANVYGFGMVIKHRGKVLSLSTQCRSGGTATPANTDILAKVWLKDGSGNKSLLATSTNYQRHGVGASLRWEFEPFEVESGDMLLVTFHTDDYADGTQYAAGHQCCFAVTSTSEAETGCIGGNGQWQYTDIVPLYTWEIQVRHAYDFISHLTADEHAGLAQLLAMKDALLALVNR